MRIKSLLIAAAVLAVMAGVTAPDAAAQFRAAEFEYGERFDLPEGEAAEIWNPAMKKLIEGGPMVGGTVRATDPRASCAMAE